MVLQPHFYNKYYMNKYEESTKHWLDKFIIGLNICPFAKKEFTTNSIRLHS